MLQPDWESQLPNNRIHYMESPVAKFQKTNGSFFPENYHSRTLNRKMKMKDTFTGIFPSYNHKS